MSNNLEDEIRAIVAGMDNQENEEQQPPADDIQDIYVLIVRETDTEDQSNSIESEAVTPPVSAKQSFEYVTLGIVLLCCIPILASILFQVYVLQNPAIATVTIIPKSQQVSLNGTLQLGRVLQPITISQSQTRATTGHGHQDARAATGRVTFYNGQLNSIFVPAGLLLTGNDGEQIVTDQDASIPASNLPQVGQATVQAHAVNTGTKGNIAVYDINQGCCATAIKAVNTNSFYGGQDERNYQTVAKADITNVATTLKSSLDVSMHGALAAQTKQNEALTHPLCSETVSPNHHVGDEANQVTVTVSETCSAVAYDNHVLATKAAQLLTTQALKKLGSGYSVFGEIHLSVKQPTVTQHPNLVFLSFQAQGTWIYGISQKAQEHIKELIVGKTKQSAMHVLVSLPGVEQVSISWGDDTKLPKDSIYIHIKLFVM